MRHTLRRPSGQIIISLPETDRLQEGDTVQCVRCGRHGLPGQVSGWDMLQNGPLLCHQHCPLNEAQGLTHQQLIDNLENGRPASWRPIRK